MAQQQKMTEEVTIVFYDRNESYPIPNSLIAEDVCMQAAEYCGIGPRARHLFGLYHPPSKTWLSPCDSILAQNKREYEFRLRFKLPQVDKLKKVDTAAFDYYFYQVRRDFIEGNLPEIAGVQGKALGLAVTDMLRVQLEQKLSIQDLEKKYKSYLPQNVFRQYRFIAFPLKNAIKESLSKLAQNPRDVSYVKEQYIQMILELKPQYGCEEYNAHIDENGRIIEVKLQLDPYHATQPGLRQQFGKKAQWVHICSIEELCYISMRNDGTVEISRRNGVPQYFKFTSPEEMKSFVSLMDGYYRLSEKWTFNLCKDMLTPSLLVLKQLKCHGPVGQEFAHKKLQQKSQGKIGSYIVRESNKYRNYRIDLITQESEPPVTFHIAYLKSGDYQMESFPQLFSDLSKLISHFSKEKLLINCIPPSEYDKSILLLCREENKEYSSVNLNNTVVAPQCIPLQNMEIIQDSDQQGKFTVVRRAIWRRNIGEKRDCALKSLRNHENLTNLQEFLKMSSNCIFWHSEAIVAMYGFILNHPTAIVMEYLPLGPLDKYLQCHSIDVHEVDLVEAATYLAKALWYLEEQNLIHGNIRCHNVLVASHRENSFKVKLSDCGIHTYDESQIHWIPPECFRNLSSAKKFPAADVWAFGTTLWEIFSYGSKPLEGVPVSEAQQLYNLGTRLSEPQQCNEDIYKLMLECWTKDPDSRKKPQAIMRDINQILYEVYNSRRIHSYATIATSCDSSCNSISSQVTVPAASPAANRKFELKVPASNMLGEIPSNGFPHFVDQSSKKEENKTKLTFDSVVKTTSSKQWPPTVSESDHGVLIIEMSQLKLGQKLGEGFYGEVHKGKLFNHEIVAVKQLKNPYTNANLPDLLREIAIMKSLQHKNIVEIKGVVEEPKTLLVMEYVPLGCLKAYFQTNRCGVSDKLLLKFACDIAEGMDYVGKKHIVHRDLAARNILVASEDTVKISDFGLAQVMGQRDYYRLKTNRDLPIRWYAPEILRTWCFTHKSDVWSFGVTLWEMFSFGAEPIIEGSTAETLLDILDSGRRLGCPEHFPCSGEVYRDFMRRCWEAEPEARPDFSVLYRDLYALWKKM